jgi:hypothetical protein
MNLQHLQHEINQALDCFKLDKKDSRLVSVEIGRGTLRLTVNINDKATVFDIHIGKYEYPITGVETFTIGEKEK